MNQINNYKNSVKWSFIEATCYQGLLCFHQYMLFKVTEPVFYGTVGAIFGGLYLLIKFFDLGLSKSLIYFYETLSTDKSSCLSFFMINMIPIIIVYIATLTFIFFLAI